MSRFDSYDDYDGPDMSGLWWDSFRRAVNSERGQRTLREIEAALLAMPEHKLIADELADGNGGVCAVGAVAAYRRVQDGQSWDDAVLSLPPIDSGHETAYYASTSLRMAKTIAWEMAQINDDGDRWAPDHWTPEQRHAAVLAWVRKRIKSEAVV